jgi:hypothetical protein
MDKQYFKIAIPALNWKASVNLFFNRWRNGKCRAVQRPFSEKGRSFERYGIPTGSGKKHKGEIIEKTNDHFRAFSFSDNFKLRDASKCR